MPIIEILCKASGNWSRGPVRVWWLLRQLYYFIPRGGLRRNAAPCPGEHKDETWAGCFA